ncbi:MAG: tail fiber protein [Nannocystaceae bacterium]
MFGGNFAPRGWALCDGQLLAISSHSSLFSILGTTYGGDGVSTFGLPDLRGRAPVHAGHGPGLSNYRLGEKTGAETVTLTTNQIPAHTHQLEAVGSPATSSDARNNGLGSAEIYVAGNPEAQMNPASIRNTGGGQSHNNIQPVLAVNYIIALVGLYPSRD